jgi:hypothetical protein
VLFQLVYEFHSLHMLQKKGSVYIFYYADIHLEVAATFGSHVSPVYYLLCVLPENWEMWNNVHAKAYSLSVLWRK